MIHTEIIDKVPLLKGMITPLDLPNLEIQDFALDFICSDWEKNQNIEISFFSRENIILMQISFAIYISVNFI